MNTVVINYSFDIDTPVFVFDTEREAREFIKEDFENEIRIQTQENSANLAETLGGDTYACIRFADGDTIEWTLTYITDKRKKTEQSRIRDTYLACRELLENAPEPSETDEESCNEMYADAANFVNDVNNLGYDF